MKLVRCITVRSFTKEQLRWIAKEAKKAKEPKTAIVKRCVVESMKNEKKCQ